MNSAIDETKMKSLLFVFVKLIAEWNGATAVASSIKKRNFFFSLIAELLVIGFRPNWPPFIPASTSHQSNLFSLIKQKKRLRLACLRWGKFVESKAGEMEFFVEERNGGRLR